MADARKPRKSILPIIIAGLAGIAIVLIITGRLMDRQLFDGWQDPFYSVFLAFTLDGSFLGEQNVVTLIGAFAAALVLYLALFGSLWVVFRSRLIAWRAARLSGHIAVIGDGDDAADLAATLAASAKVLLVGDAEARGRHPAIARSASVPGLVASAGLGEARAVVVMLADERQNAAIATAIARGRAGAARPVIWARIADELLADRVSGVVSGAARILVFDEAQMVARDLFARHPAHAVAERMAAPRVHFLVAGFGRLGHAVAEEAVFSGIAAGLDRPMVTVLDRDASALGALYREGRPALDLAADFAFIDAPFSAARQGPVLGRAALAALAARDDIAPVTGIVICLGDDAANFRLALALPDIRRREGRYSAPAYIEAGDGAGGTLFETAAGAPVGELVRPTRLIASDILDAARRDEAARQLHAAYLGAAGRSAGAATDWLHLPETYRRANRRSADHIAAKLFSLGLTAEHDVHAPITVEAAAHAATIAPLASAEGGEALDMLAALENRRWIADRVIDGWAEGARDDDRKLHPLLREGGYGALPAVEQAKDRQQVATVLSAIAPGAGAGVRREIRLALAGHRDLSPAEEARGAAELVALLAPGLARSDLAVTLVSPLAPGADMALCEAFVGALAGKAGEVRLLVPEAAPWPVVLEIAAREAGGGAEAERAFIARMMQRRAALMARVARADNVRIGFAGATDDSYRRNNSLFLKSLQRANAYLVRRSDRIALLWDGEAARGPGGTGEIAAFWTTPDLIPAEADVPQSWRHGPPVPANLYLATVSRYPLRT